MNFKIIALSILLSFTFLTTYSQTETKAKNKKNALKVTFLSLYTGSTKITYERSVFDSQSIEITLGRVSWGYDAFDNNPSGMLGRLAYKFIFYGNPNYPLNGLYVKPELAVTGYYYDKESALEEVKPQRDFSKMATLMGCVGYQWAKRIFVAEGFVGAGLGIGNPADTRYQHGFITRWQYLTLTFGMKIGFSFGKKNEI